MSKNKNADADAGAGTKRAAQSKTQSKAKTLGLVLGGIPSVRLLPPTFETDAKSRRLRSNLILGVIAITVIVILGAGAALLALTNATIQLESEEARTGLIRVEQQKYASVTTLETQQRDLETAQQLAAAGEIQWSPYLQLVSGTLPVGTSITAIDASLVEPDDVSTTVPLLTDHIAVIGLTVDSPQASVSDWLDAMKTLPGFVDATPGNVVLVPETGRYTVEVDLLVNEAALALRFEPEETE
ncbi:Fimbrial assembly [Leifsonia rubra CMS 76R]|nr:Fimbrial assembly [Leifsonia rubra CMS 76R]